MMPGVLFLASCGGNDPEAEKPELTPIQKAALVFEKTATDAELEKGRQVWLGTCKACHSTGLAGAPFIGDKQLWAPRIAKGMDTLFSHALNGFESDVGNTMPARGGNLELKDEQVISAVKYMVSVSK